MTRKEELDTIIEALKTKIYITSQDLVTFSGFKNIHEYQQRLTLQIEDLGKYLTEYQSLNNLNNG